MEVIYVLLVQISQIAYHAILVVFAYNVFKDIMKMVLVGVHNVQQIVLIVLMQPFVLNVIMGSLYLLETAHYVV